jgi:hypothetical protein
VLHRSSIKRAPIVDCRIRSVFNYGYDANGVLSRTSYAVEDHHAKYSRGITLDKMDPLTHSDAVFVEMAGDDKIGLDVKKCDQFASHWFTGFYCESEAECFDLPVTFPAEKLAAANSSLLTDSLCSMADGTSFRRKHRLLPSGANKVKLIETAMTTWCIVRAVLKLWRQNDICPIKLVGVLADNATMSTDVYQKELAAELVLSFDYMDQPLKEDDEGNKLLLERESHDFLGFQLIDGSPVKDEMSFFAAWYKPERYLGFTQDDQDMRQVARACGYSQTNMGVHPRVHAFFADVVRELTHPGVPLPNISRDDSFRNLNFEPGRQYTTADFMRRRIASPYRGLCDLARFVDSKPDLRRIVTEYCAA